MKILVINAGSSSLKYQLIDMADDAVLAKGVCERIGAGGVFTHKTPDGRGFKKEVEMPDHGAAFHQVMDALLTGDAAVLSGMDESDAVGHRVVNGGEKFYNSVLVTEKVLEDFAEVINFAPLHNPPAMAGIRACLDVFGPKVPMALVFDTAFHTTIPSKAYIYPIEYKYYEKYHIRKYGAHGTSHRYVAMRCAELMGRPLEELKIVTCHLGNGSSISAVKYGKCIDTSMGLTPLAGIMMGTRSGTIDPSVVTAIMQKENLSPAEMENILNKKSGYLGVSGISSANRDLEDAVGAGNERATLAIDMMNYQCQQYIGMYTAAMNGIDALVFTAGIGENSNRTRDAVTRDMTFFGIDIDRPFNASLPRGAEADLTAPGARARTFVIPTNEELMIALDTKRLVEEAR